MCLSRGGLDVHLQSPIRGGTAMKATIAILLLALAAPAAGQVRRIQSKDGTGFVEMSGPRMTAAEAAAVLCPQGACQQPPVCADCDGPHIIFSSSGPSLGPWDFEAGMG